MLWLKNGPGMKYFLLFFWSVKLCNECWARWNFTFIHVLYMFYFYNLFSTNKIFVFNTHPNISSNKLINERKLTDLWCVWYVFLFYFNHRCSSEVLCIYQWNNPWWFIETLDSLKCVLNFSFWKWRLKYKYLQPVFIWVSDI